MATRPDPSSRRRTSSGGGGGWLVLLVLVAAAGATVVFAGDKLRDLFGISHKPQTDGTEPVVPSDVVSHAVPMTPPETTQSSAVHTDKPVIDTTPTKPVIVSAPTKPSKEMAAADALLVQAEKSYRTFKWEDARSAADRILTMQGSPKTLARANVISSSAPELEKLFLKLGEEKDELRRNYDTNPGLVQIGASNPLYAVAMSGGDVKDPILVEDHAVEYITQTNQTQRVQAFVKGNKDFILTTLPETLTDISLVDQVAVRHDKEQEFSKKLAALRNSAAAHDAMSWYQAAKFAYRNRLDDQVTQMLDTALDLDPNLVSTVREEKAGKLCSAMVLHIKSGSRKQADIYMDIIRRRYSDTEQGKQAAAIYAGDMAEMVKLAALEDAKRKQDEIARQEARIERAKLAGDTEKMKQIQEEKPEEPEAPVAAAEVGSSSEAAADSLVDQGLPLYRKAMDMPAVAERNDVYKKAASFFKQAVAQYTALINKDPGNVSLQGKMVEAHKMWFGCEKYQTAF